MLLKTLVKRVIRTSTLQILKKEELENKHDPKDPAMMARNLLILEIALKSQWQSAVLGDDIRKIVSEDTGIITDTRLVLIKFAMAKSLRFLAELAYCLDIDLDEVCEMAVKNVK